MLPCICPVHVLFTLENKGAARRVPQHRVQMKPTSACHATTPCACRPHAVHTLPTRGQGAKPRNILNENHKILSTAAGRSQVAHGVHQQRLHVYNLPHARASPQAAWPFQASTAGACHRAAAPSPAADPPASRLATSVPRAAYRAAVRERPGYRLPARSGQTRDALAALTRRPRLGAPGCRLRAPRGASSAAARAPARAAGPPRGTACR